MNFGYLVCDEGLWCACFEIIMKEFRLNSQDSILHIIGSQKVVVNLIEELQEEW